MIETKVLKSFDVKRTQIITTREVDTTGIMAIDEEDAKKILDKNMHIENTGCCVESNRFSIPKMEMLKKEITIEINETK